MKSKLFFVVAPDTPLRDMLIKFSAYDDAAIACVMADTKLTGIVCQVDLQRLLSTSDADLDKVTANDVANKTFVRFNMEQLENNMVEFLRSNQPNIRTIPIVDQSDHLYTAIGADSFVNDEKWQISQLYEMGYWNAYFKRNQKQLIKHAKQVHDDFINRVYHDRFFSSFDKTMNDEIFHYTTGKSVLEIGCGPFGGFLPAMWWAKERIAIEPLANQYQSSFGEVNASIWESIDEKYSIGGNIYIPQLKHRIDGMIICQNSLDHTPDWAFVLSNLCSYAAEGSYLYLWSDILHCCAPDAGHYNITPNGENITRMLENFGYRIIQYNSNGILDRENLYINVLARKSNDRSLIEPDDLRKDHPTA